MGRPARKLASPVRYRIATPQSRRMASGDAARCARIKGMKRSRRDPAKFRALLRRIRKADPTLDNLAQFVGRILTYDDDAVGVVT